MLLNILKQINWVDIFVLILFVRVCYLAVKGGFPIELFKFSGTITAAYLSLHYYIALSGYLINWLSLGKRMPLEFLQFIVFLVLAAGGYYIFVLLRGAFQMLIKMEAVSTLNKWGSLMLGIARAIILASLIIFMLVISTVGYFKSSVKASYTGMRLFLIAPDTYSWIWNSVTSKFTKSEKYNETVTSINDELLKQ